MTFGERIRKRREEINMSQQELAEKLGYSSRSSINKIELGLIDLPQSKIEKCAEILQIPINELFGLSSTTASGDKYKFTYAAYDELTHDLDQDKIDKLKAYADFLRTQK